MHHGPTPTGREITFGDDEIIVSKTDPRGVITYANDVFARVSGYPISHLVGAPHNLIRHPAMPRGVFKYLWDTIQGGEEVFAYVLNLARNGDGYWVFAHVTPSFDTRGNIIGYHSSRRSPHPDAVAKARALYRTVLDVERPCANPREAAATGLACIVDLLAQNQTDYPSFVFGLSAHTTLAASVG